MKGHKTEEGLGASFVYEEADGAWAAQTAEEKAEKD